MGPNEPSIVSFPFSVYVSRRVACRAERSFHIPSSYLTLPLTSPPPRSALDGRVKHRDYILQQTTSKVLKSEGPFES